MASFVQKVRAGIGLPSSSIVHVEHKTRDVARVMHGDDVIVAVCGGHFASLAGSTTRGHVQLV